MSKQMRWAALNKVVAKTFGNETDREIKRVRPLLRAINDLESQIQRLSEIDLAAKTTEFKERLRSGATFEDIQVEAFAVLREAGRRVLDVRFPDIYLVAGIALHCGKIAQIDAGEDKSFIAAIPAYLNALGGGGVHVISVDDYVATRDCGRVGRVFGTLGLRADIIGRGFDAPQRRNAYSADITYGAGKEFGFDYLRDNMASTMEDCVQRNHSYAIVNEVDHILIDQARSPLVISAPIQNFAGTYHKCNEVIPHLVRGEVIEGKNPGERHLTGDYTVDENHRSCLLTEAGTIKVERLLGIGNVFEPQNAEWGHHIYQSLNAHAILLRDRDYVVHDSDTGPIVTFMDARTGHLLPEERWRDGLRQAVEAKERVKITPEEQVPGSITPLGYFRTYDKLAGITATATSESPLFEKFYGLETTVVPRSQPATRVDRPDVVYRTELEKFRNAAREVAALHDVGQPVLVCVSSVEKSKQLQTILSQMGVPQNTLDVNSHETSAGYLAVAGRRSAVTIAISGDIALRASDIRLGGDPEFLAQRACLDDGLAQLVSEDGMTQFPSSRDHQFTFQRRSYRVPTEVWRGVFGRYGIQASRERQELKALGGLCVVGIDRNDSPRINLQIRGCAGRNAQPGSSRFYLSLPWELSQISELMLQSGAKEDAPIESDLLNQKLAATTKSRADDIDKAVVGAFEYDLVIAKHLKAIYGMRRQLLAGNDQKERLKEMTRRIINRIIGPYRPETSPSGAWDLDALRNDVFSQFGFMVEIGQPPNLSASQMSDTIMDHIRKKYREKEDSIGADLMRKTERTVMLQVVDEQWQDHMLSMDHLREGVALLIYARKDPLEEFKKQSFTLFQNITDRIEGETVRRLITSAR